LEREEGKRKEVKREVRIIWLISPSGERNLRCGKKKRKRGRGGRREFLIEIPLPEREINS